MSFYNGGNEAVFLLVHVCPDQHKAAVMPNCSMWGRCIQQQEVVMAWMVQEFPAESTKRVLPVGGEKIKYIQGLLIDGVGRTLI